MTITPEVLADLRKKAEAATRGPWLPRCDYRWDLHWLGNDKNHASVATADGTDLVDREICRFQADGSPGDLEQVRADIEHVAAANPTVVLALLDRIEALEAAVAEISTTCESKELRPGGDTLAPSEVVDRVWDIARAAYGERSAVEHHGGLHAWAEKK